MILPIYAFGHPVLRKECDEIESQYKDLSKLIKDMYETMYSASGVGLAAPQVGLSIRLFITDATQYALDFKDSKDPEEQREYENLKNFKKVFINPIIIEETGDEWGFEEGCLSIPDIRAEVNRQERVVIEYYDENWELKEETYDGFAARVIQHEYDHIEGVLFTDLVNPVRKRLIQNRLKRIKEGNIETRYKMKFLKQR
ncbi:MAG: peptide deformylase [Flavobacteriales bacterium]|nr:peptide deformylase [Flavobacteriales bacterium]